MGHNNKEVPVRLTVEPAMVGRTRVLTATGKQRGVCLLLAAVVLAACWARGQWKISGKA